MGEKESVQNVVDRYDSTIPQAFTRLKKRSRSDENADRPPPKRVRGVQAPPSSPDGRGEVMRSGINFADIQKRLEGQLKSIGQARQNAALAEYPMIQRATGFDEMMSGSAGSGSPREVDMNSTTSTVREKLESMEDVLDQMTSLNINIPRDHELTAAMGEGGEFVSCPPPPRNRPCWGPFGYIEPSISLNNLPTPTLTRPSLEPKTFPNQRPPALALFNRELHRRETDI